MKVDEIIAGLRKPPRAPSELRARGAGRRWWRRMLSRYEVRVDEEVVVEGVAHTRDEIEAMRTELASSPTLAVTGSRGAIVEHPLLEAIRRHEALLLKQLSYLGLAEADVPGDAASRAGSALVNKRWARRRGG